MRIRWFTWVLFSCIFTANLFGGTLTVTQDGGGDGFVRVNGTDQADLFVDSNDPDEPSITIPVTMTVTTTSVTNHTNENGPRACSILRNFPNPFNPDTLIFLSVSKPVEVKISICDMLGRRVKTFMKRQYAPGMHEIEWDGTDDQFRSAASGIYLFVLSDGSRTLSRKMIKLE
jgi:hypothetical protein